MGHDVVYISSVKIVGTDFWYLPVVTFLWLVSMSSLIAVYLISKAFIQGLASARHPEHRMTPQIPWYFFDPFWRRIIAKALLMEVALYFFIFLLTYAFPLILGIDPAMGIQGLGFFFLVKLGWFFASLIFVLFLAPNHPSPFFLSVLTVFCGAFCTFVILLGLFFLFIDTADNLDLPNWVPPLVMVVTFCLATSITFLSFWRGVRADPNFYWFRFES